MEKKKKDMVNKVIQGDCLEKLKNLEDNSVDAVVTDPPYGLSFMGKKWDYDVPSTEIWKECLRVLKPGGYLLSFAGTRTQHRMAVRIEDAGFEIRDMIAWVYGSGFPKSLNIGKAVDKLQGNEREVVGKRIVPDQRGGGINSQRTAEIGVPTRMTTDTKGTSEWEGWGTALKPALEPITVARKPLSEKTVAKNVLKWGTGGINIDGSRVATTELTPRNNKQSATWGTYGSGYTEPSEFGRFPANLIHDGSDEVVELFPNSKSSDAVRKNNQSKNTGADNGASCYGKYNDIDTNGYSDNGSNARFFYCAKASKSERNRGCEGLEEKVRVRQGLAGEKKDTASTNSHPTVKPIALMEYLVKLVTKENAIVLDPFAGSGSTLLACKNLNRNYIGIEREADYIKIINKRLQ
jgi:site-specific DNA-methyltransferase (adenine-specific)